MILRKNSGFFNHMKEAVKQILRISQIWQMRIL